MTAEACALARGDVLLADRLMFSWSEIVMLQQRGVDCVCRFAFASRD